MGLIHTNHFSSKFWPFQTGSGSVGVEMVAGLMQLFKPLAYRHSAARWEKGRRGPQAHRDLNVVVESSIMLFNVSLTAGISRLLLPPAGRQHELHNRGYTFNCQVATLKFRIPGLSQNDWMQQAKKHCIESWGWTKHLRQTNSRMP